MQVVHEMLAIKRSAGNEEKPSALKVFDFSSRPFIKKTIHDSGAYNILINTSDVILHSFINECLLAQLLLIFANHYVWSLFQHVFECVDVDVLELVTVEFLLHLLIFLPFLLQTIKNVVFSFFAAYY